MFSMFPEHIQTSHLSGGTGWFVTGLSAVGGFHCSKGRSFDWGTSYHLRLCNIRH